MIGLLPDLKIARFYSRPNGYRFQEGAQMVELQGGVVEKMWIQVAAPEPEGVFDKGAFISVQRE